MTVWFLDYQGTLDRTMSWGTYLGLLVERGDKIIINTGDAYFAARRVAAWLCRHAILLREGRHSDEAGSATRGKG